MSNKLKPDMNGLGIEEFKQAGHEYTFFHELRLKYLAFYTAVLGIITAAFINILLSPGVLTEKITKILDRFKSCHGECIKEISSSSVEIEISRFLTHGFLLLCGSFLIIIGIVVGFVLIKCRDKAVTSIKSLMSIRKLVAKGSNYSDFRKYFHHSLSVPRHYKLLSPTQGIIFIIIAINSIVLLSFFFAINGSPMEAIVKLFASSPVPVVVIIGSLAFLQYLLVYNYMIKKDVVNVKLEFDGPTIEKVKLEYHVPRSLTNSSFGNAVARVMFYLIGLTEKGIAFFKKKEVKEFDVENNELKLKLIAGHYKIITPEFGEKDLLIFGDIYEEFFKKIEVKKLYLSTGRADNKTKLREVKEFTNTLIRYAFYILLFLSPLLVGLKKSNFYWVVFCLLVVYSLWKLFKSISKTQTIRDRIIECIIYIFLVFLLGALWAMIKNVDWPFVVSFLKNIASKHWIVLLALSSPCIYSLYKIFRSLKKKQKEKL